MSNKFSNKAVLANPTAQGLHNGELSLNQPQKLALKQFTNSAHCAITEEDYEVLRTFYETTRQQETKLGKLYQSISFKQFVERLVTKRFDKAYLDGRQIFPRQYTDESDPLRQFYKKYPEAFNNPSLNRCNLLDVIGTELDEFNVCDEYLSLAELSVSALVLMTTTDVVIGRGARGNWSGRSDQWYDYNIRKEFYKEQAKDSALAVVFSYPAGIEFRGANSAALDTAYCLVSKNTDNELTKRRQMTKNNPALGETLHGLYGKRSALSFENFKDAQTDRSQNPEDWIEVQKGALLLYIPAYRAKTERILKQIILAHDRSMASLGMGKVLNLKGLGLGAFGISGCNTTLEKIFLQALCKVHQELAGRLQYIECINLINSPSMFKPGQKLPTTLSTLAEDKDGVRLTANCMDPTAQYLVNPGEPGYGTPEYEVGGVVFCGDPATLPGNEARICHRLPDKTLAPVGLQADSSDDPAQMYAMLQPTEFDPLANPHMLENPVILSADTLPAKGDDLNVSRTMIRQIKQRLESPAEVMKYPASYQKLYSAGATEKESLRQLLDDYTKGNSWLKLLVYCHLGRNHISEVSDIVRLMDTNQLNSSAEILERLKTIPLKNQHGSLSRRIAFLEEKLVSDHEEKDELGSDLGL